MTHGKAKDQLLGETAKTYLREVWVAERLGRKKYDNVNNYTIKGVMVESDSLQMVSEVTGVTLFKNKKFFENEFICGTPDVIKPSLEDIKSSWDIWSFVNVDEKKARQDYEWQMQGYMFLLDESVAKLTYALVSTPREIAENELYRLSMKLQVDQLEAAEKNYYYDDLPKLLRIKSFTINQTDEHKQEIMLQVMAAREYLKSLDLTYSI